MPVPLITLVKGRSFFFFFFFFFNDTATTEIYTLSLHDALPICFAGSVKKFIALAAVCLIFAGCRSEEHTSELQSHVNLVCRLLLETKNQIPLLRDGRAAHLDELADGCVDEPR